MRRCRGWPPCLPYSEVGGQRSEVGGERAISRRLTQTGADKELKQKNIRHGHKSRERGAGEQVGKWAGEQVGRER